MSGRASPELVEELHRALAVRLVANLKDNPSAEMLGCARSYLRDQGLTGTPDTDKDRKVLRRILKLYVQALTKSLEEGDASASMLAEVGRFLFRSGVVADLSSKVDSMRALRDFTALDLPFQ